MDATDLPVLIASGILLAAMVLFGVKSAAIFFKRGDLSAAFFVAVPTALIGGGLILAGLGFIAW